MRLRVDLLSSRRLRVILQAAARPMQSSAAHTAFIGGRFRAAADASAFQVLNPATGEIVGTASNCDVADAREAVESAKTAFERWGFQTTAKQRSTALRRLYERVMADSDEMAKLLTREQGKPLAEAKGEIAYGAGFFEWFSGEAQRVCGEVVPPTQLDRQHLHVREPSGVVAIVTPWNFPLAMIARKMGAALAVGCTCVVKPAEDTPLTAVALARHWHQVAEELDLPPGILNVVTADRANSADVGKFLCESEDVDVVSFTGSTAVGKLLLAQSASTVKRVCLELGGNAPFIVFDSADMERAVAGAMASKFRASGQTCVCANRILVQSSVFDRFVERFAEAIGQLKVGDGLAVGVTQGPLINERAVDKVEALVRDAAANGARVLVGGQRHEMGGNFFQPTLVTDVRPDMALCRTEIFGPVASVVRFDSEQEAVRLANDCRVGLAGYFYSRHLAQVFGVARRLRVGMVGVNEGIISCQEALFGGVRESGLGREGGRQGVDEFTNWKYVCLGGL